MNCPRCQKSTKVVNSRPLEGGRAVKRRRECLHCSQRFSTYERLSLGDFRVVKRNDSKELYARHKIEAGLRKALEKRPVTEAQFQKLLFDIEADVFSLGKEKISSEQIGRIVLDRLKKIDKVGYLRFASVYRNFRSPQAFAKEIERLEKVGARA
ncbi:MAG: transcriptional repressor NrdR [Parcubacteria group bacterium]|nr:transcriptional repressor NrdR [Parcubacteria group bacterium]